MRLIMLADTTATDTRLLADIARQAEELAGLGLPREVALEMCWANARELTEAAVARGESDDYTTGIAFRAATLATVIKLVYSLTDRGN